MENQDQNSQNDNVKSLPPEIEAQVIAKAWKDDAFKQSLMKNSKHAIEEAFGYTLSNEIEVTVLEETSQQHYLILPPEPEGELSEEALEAAAGGLLTICRVQACISRATTEPPPVYCDLSVNRF